MLDFERAGKLVVHAPPRWRGCVGLSSIQAVRVGFVKLCNAIHVACMNGNAMQEGVIFVRLWVARDVQAVEKCG